MKIALYQCLPGSLDVEGNLRRLDHVAAQAVAQGAKVLVLPELFSTGYAIGAEAVQQLAEPVDGPFAEHAARIARTHGVALCYGYPERGRDGAIYNSAMLLGVDGQPLLNYRKWQLFGALDREQFSEGDGAPRVANLLGWQVGLQICYDVEFPEGVRHLASAGAELVLVPTANMRGFEFIADVTVRSRAFENLCFVAYANYVGVEGPFEYCGRSSVNGPKGSRFDLPGEGEGLLVVDISRDEREAALRDNPYLTDYRTFDH